MKRHFDIRRYLYVLVIFTVVLYLLSTFLPGGSLSAADAVFGVLFLAACAGVVYLTVDFFAVTINYAAPLVFACLALSFPSVAVYSPLLWAAAAQSLAFYLAARYYGGDVNDDHAFLFCALAVTASLIFPPLAWTLLFLIIMNISTAADKPRFLVSCIAGCLLPPVVFLSYRYFCADMREVTPLLGQYFDSLLSPAMDLGANSAARVIKVVTLVVCCAVSLVSFLRRNAEYSVSHSRVMTFIFAYSAVIVLLLALFPSGCLPMNVMLAMVPVSLVVYDYLVWGAADRGCRIAVAFLSLSLLLESAFLVLK